MLHSSVALFLSLSFLYILVHQATWRPPPDGSSVPRNEKYMSTINCNVRLASSSPPVVTAVCHSQVPFHASPNYPLSIHLIHLLPKSSRHCQQSNLVSTYCDGGRNYNVLENLLLSMDVQVIRDFVGCCASSFLISAYSQNYVQRTNFGCPLKDS
jgi:hypothetical protein